LVRCCRTMFPGTRVAEPVIAEDEATCLRPKRNRRNDWLRVPWAPEATHHRCAPARAPLGTRITRAVEHATSRTGGRAVHGIVPMPFECRWAQYRVGLPREWPLGEVRDSHQAGRRDARRWPRPPEKDERLTPPQGGEPERRRDQRRTRRQAGGLENRSPAAATATAAAAAAAAAIRPSPSRHRSPVSVTGTGSGWTPHRNDFAGKPVIRVAL
jgi:hypothetical protein